MKEVKVFEVDKYELGIIINALNEFRNILIQQERETSPIDELLLKVLNAPQKKRMFPRRYLEDR
ncbi:MAG: hypothetical protein E7161_01290 [Firmicutes bacterium]|nr:hypothetical protein [Bacillota bacterium]